jgi:hypothetical protein
MSCSNSAPPETLNDRLRRLGCGLTRCALLTTPQSLSPSVPRSSEDLSNVMVGFFDCIYSSAPQGKSPDPQEVGQLSDAHVSDSLNLQSENSHVLAPFDSWDIEIPDLPSSCSPIPEQFDLYMRECAAPSQDNVGLSAQLIDPA